MRVEGSGPHTCNIAIVGEAPEASEDSTGIPLCGASDELLSKMMHNVGIIREQCYITNVIKHRPPNNDASIFISFERGKIRSTPDYDAYEQELYAELERTTANCIVVLGNIPLYALTRRVGITKWRGSLLEWRGRKVIPTIHPAAALSEWLHTYSIMHDLSTVAKEQHDRVFRYPERILRIKPSYAEAMQYLKECSIYDKVGFDIEVINNEMSCFAIAKSSKDCMSIPFYSKGQNYFPPDQELDIMVSLANILFDKRVVKVGQNLAFDSTFMMRRYGIAMRNMQDTMIAQAIVGPEFPKGLDFITSMYTRENYYKDEGKKYMKIGGDEDAFWLYNAKDAAIVLDALPAIWDSVLRLHNSDTVHRQTALLDPLLYMQNRGIRINRDGLRAASAKSGEKIKALVCELHAITGYELNPDSPKQVMDYFYNKKGIKAYVNRKTGNESSDEEALKRIARKGYEEATILLAIRGESKQKSTYYDMKIDEDGRLRCSFNPVGTKQGRLSSRKDIFGNGGNMQNLTPEFKRYMLADDGYVLYNMDLSQAENRIVAYTAPDPNMIRAFESGIDIHSLTASLIFGGDIADIKREDKLGIPCALGSGTRSKRFWGKKANHGLNYDLGYRAFALLYEIPEGDSKFIWTGYRRSYPGVDKYHKWIKEKLGRDRILTNCMGRNRKFFDRWGDNLFKEAFSYIPQSTVADIINERGLCYIYNHISTNLLEPVELLNQIHDAILLQIPLSIGIEQHKEILRAIKKSLETPIHWNSFTFTIPVDIKVGINAHDMIDVSIDTLEVSIDKALTNGKAEAVV